MKLEAEVSLLEFSPYDQSAYGGQNMGDVVKCADGRWFRFAKDSGSGNHKGYLQQGPTIVADGQNMSCLAAVAIGGTRVTSTYGTTALTAGVYDEGYMIVNAGTGLGQMAKIKHSSAVTASIATDPNGTAYGLIIDIFDFWKVHRCQHFKMDDYWH